MGVPDCGPCNLVSKKMRAAGKELRAKAPGVTLAQLTITTQASPSPYPNPNHHPNPTPTPILTLTLTLTLTQASPNHHPNPNHHHHPNPNPNTTTTPRTRLSSARSCKAPSRCPRYDTAWSKCLPGSAPRLLHFPWRLWLAPQPRASASAPQVLIFRDGEAMDFVTERHSNL